MGMLLLPIFAPWRELLPLGARQDVKGAVAEPA